nr:immunoglobulin heavy chain junction region [Mus musculus]
ITVHPSTMITGPGLL